jgi:hypothetical protein
LELAINLQLKLFTLETVNKLPVAINHSHRGLHQIGLDADDVRVLRIRVGSRQEWD